MQNIDFSSQIRRRPVTQARSNSKPATPTDFPAQITPTGLKSRNRLISLTLAGLVLVFTVGLFSGIKIGELRNLEQADCIVRYPDGKQKSVTAIIPAKNNTSKLSNTGNTPVTNKLVYIIKVGYFPTPAARKLTQQLNSLPEIRKLTTSSCKGVQETVANRAPVFRMQVDNKTNSENILVGCFKAADRANHILSTIRKSGLPGSSRAELYEY